MARLVTAIGLMSGTSLDGVDAAIIATDGELAVECGPALTIPYAEPVQAKLRSILGCRPEERSAEIAEIAAELTRLHGDAVRALLAESGNPTVEVIGFHGHTIFHRPREGVTYQIGDGSLLASLTGIDVINDFRSEDVAAGGEGAPFVPLFHVAMAADQPHPLAVLNLGGVGNVTWIGEDMAPIAFDTGPGNALMDDWMRRHTGEPYDKEGQLAASGRPDRAVLAHLLGHPYFALRPPKSLDRNEFAASALDAVAGLSLADGAATLAAFTAHSVARAFDHLPAAPLRLLVTGGGRHNRALMTALAALLPFPVSAVEAVGWNGDALEAQAFGYLAVRSLRGLPLSLPSTTGARRPTQGGRLHRAARRLKAGA